MSKNQSFVLVSTDWVIRTATNLKRHIYKKRMGFLKKRAEKNLSTPRFIFFGKKRTFTKKQLNEEIRRLWQSDSLDDFMEDFRWWGQIPLDMVKEIIKAASVAENGVMFLSVEDASQLKEFE